MRWWDGSKRCSRREALIVWDRSRRSWRKITLQPNWPPCSGCTDSITSDCSRRLGATLRQKLRQTTGGNSPTATPLQRCQLKPIGLLETRGGSHLRPASGHSWSLQRPVGASSTPDTTQRHRRLEGRDARCHRKKLARQSLWPLRLQLRECGAGLLVPSTVQLRESSAYRPAATWQPHCLQSHSSLDCRKASTRPPRRIRQALRASLRL